jgi:DNA replication protein DnaD
VAEKKKNQRLKGTRRKKLVEKIRRLIGKNYSDEEMCQALDLHPSTLTAVKTEILTFDKTFFEHLDSSAVMSDYLLKAKQNIKDLNHLINTTNVRSAQGSEKAAYVGAIKLRAEIHDKCVKMGQDLGHIDKRAKEMKLDIEGSVDFNLSAMSNADIQSEIKAEVQKLHELAAGTVVNMREDLLGVTGDEVRKFLPAPHDARPKAKKPKRKKVSLRK